jgi:hypothetical protein
VYPTKHHHYLDHKLLISLSIIVNNSIFIIITTTYFFIWSDSSPLVGAFNGTFPPSGLFAENDDNNDDEWLYALPYPLSPLLYWMSVDCQLCDRWMVVVGRG